MNVLARLKPFTTVVLDIDGVLTNGQILLSPDGIQLRSMNIKDGYALQLAVKSGFRIIVISGGSSEESADRLRRLGIKEIYINVADKMGFLVSLGIVPDQVIYMGDDMPDMELLQAAGFAACPSDAAEDVLDICHYISPQRGGEGAVRDVLEKLLRLNGHWPQITHLQSR